MMTDLELYLYSDRYGPTNEKLASTSKSFSALKIRSFPRFLPAPPPEMSPSFFHPAHERARI
jgi:hypothetical protein